MLTFSVWAQSYPTRHGKIKKWLLGVQKLFLLHTNIQDSSEAQEDPETVQTSACGSSPRRRRKQFLGRVVLLGVGRGCYIFSATLGDIIFQNPLCIQG